MRFKLFADQRLPEVVPREQWLQGWRDKNELEKKKKKEGRKISKALDILCFFCLIVNLHSS